MPVLLWYAGAGDLFLWSGFCGEAFLTKIQRELRRGQAPTLFRFCGGSVFGNPEQMSKPRMGVLTVSDGTVVREVGNCFPGGVITRYSSLKPYSFGGLIMRTLLATAAFFMRRVGTKISAVAALLTVGAASALSLIHI